jgi:hypothetical protein
VGFMGVEHRRPSRARLGRRGVAPAGCPRSRRVRVWHAAAAAPDGLARRAWSGLGLDGAGTGAGPRSGGGTNRPAGPRAAAGLRRPVKQGKLREHNQTTEAG